MNLPARPATKKMALGIDAELAAARAFSNDENLPSYAFPKKSASVAEAPLAQVTSATPVSNITPLTAAPAEQPAPPVASPSNITSLPTAKEKKARGTTAAPTRRYSVDLPIYVIEHIRNQAHKEKKTKRQYMLEVLKAGGFDIKDVDISEGTTDAQ